MEVPDTSTSSPLLNDIDSCPLMEENPLGFKLADKKLLYDLQTARFIKYTRSIPKYLETHPEGFAYIMNIQHLLPASATDLRAEINADVHYRYGHYNSER
ncbi:hypothetical protein N7451_011582 [Penicillium sp. IBT 35674x]|nr:hypothetical protein N7451_011582 [Penicillium sp. IBT 35674x]